MINSQSHTLNKEQGSYLIQNFLVQSLFYFMEVFHMYLVIELGGQRLVPLNFLSFSHKMFLASTMKILKTRNLVGSVAKSM